MGRLSSENFTDFEQVRAPPPPRYNQLIVLFAPRRCLTACMVCVAPALLCFSLPPSLPSSLIFLADMVGIRITSYFPHLEIPQIIKVTLPVKYLFPNAQPTVCFADVAASLRCHHSEARHDARVQGHQCTRQDRRHGL